MADPLPPSKITRLVKLLGDLAQHVLLPQGEKDTFSGSHEELRSISPHVFAYCGVTLVVVVTDEDEGEAVVPLVVVCLVTFVRLE